MDRNEKLIHRIKEIDPKVEIRFKDEKLPWYTWIAFKFVSLFNKEAMTKYTTVVGSKIYFPSRKKYEENPDRSFATLAHEYVHVYDRVQHKPKVLFNIKYAFPQIFGLLGLFGFLGFLNPWLFMLFAPFALFAPWPAPWRVEYERRGYHMSLFVYQMMHKSYDVEHVVKQFNTNKYYWMSWSEKSTREWWAEAEKEVKMRVLTDPLQIEVFNIYHELS